MPFTSLYEQLYPLTTIMKQRLVENFSGNILDIDRWGLYDGTYVMSDEADGGLLITTGPATYAAGTVGFAEAGNSTPTVSQYANPCTMIFNLRSVTTTQPNTHGGGLVGQIRGDMANNNSAIWVERANFTKWVQRNIDGSGNQSDVASTLSYTQDNQDWHNFKLELDGVTTKGSIDGVLATVNSTYTPASSQKLSPMWGMQNQTNGSPTSIAVNYCEVYNN
jgi:hypothetical protein